MRRKDWLILGIVLVASLILFLLRPGVSGTDTATPYLRITVPGQTYELIPLDAEQEIVIDQEDGSHNVIEVFQGGFRMKESNCANQDCVLQGDVTVDNIGGRALANEVICLPHKVVLELVTASGDPVEAAQ